MKRDIYFCDLCGKELNPNDYTFAERTPEGSRVKWMFGEIKMEWIADVTKEHLVKHIEHICGKCIGEIWNKIVSLKKDI